MFDSQEKIYELIQLLKERKVVFTHACQLKDFKSYMKLGGVPSRGFLESMDFGFTKFESDLDDKANNIWDKVFGNLQDLGTFFHSRKMGIPTAYGPILIKMDPDCLEYATDVAICLRSAGAKGFNRVRESLKTIEQLNSIFKNNKTDRNSDYIKSKTELENTPELQGFIMSFLTHSLHFIPET